MARLTHLKPGADQGISADWESVEHEWSILAMVPSNNRLPGPVPSGDRAPETVEGRHHAILNFAISASQLEEVVPDCGSEASAASCAISLTESFGQAVTRKAKNDGAA